MAADCDRCVSASASTFLPFGAAEAGSPARAASRTRDTRRAVRLEDRVMRSSLHAVEPTNGSKLSARNRLGTLPAQGYGPTPGRGRASPKTRRTFTLTPPPPQPTPLSDRYLPGT